MSITTAYAPLCLPTVHTAIHAMPPAAMIPQTFAGTTPESTEATVSVLFPIAWPSAWRRRLSNLLCSWY
jgi:hypothetical protein